MSLNVEVASKNYLSQFFVQIGRIHDALLIRVDIISVKNSENEFNKTELNLKIN